jgi:hypothetical protein
LKTLLGSISLLSSDHFNETETARLFGVRIKHDLALLDITIFLKEAGNFLLRETRMNTSNEEVGSRVYSAVILGSAIIFGRATRVSIAVSAVGRRSRSAIAVTARRRLAACWARRCAAVTLVTGSLVFVASSVLVFIVHGGHVARCVRLGWT